MKSLNTYISEGGFFKNVGATRIKPKDKQELIKIIKDTIAKDGPNCDLNFIDTSKIDNMISLFREINFNGDISEWDVSNVTDMASMFYNSNFNGDISKWDVSKVTNMACMFMRSSFNGDISKWDVSNVNNMIGMFNNSQFAGDISKWDVSNVKNSNKSNMFHDSKLEKLNKLPKWYKK